MIMQIKIIIPVLLLCCAGPGRAQQADSPVVRGRFSNTGYAEAILYRFGLEETAIAKAPIRDGQFRLALPPSLPPGVYRLKYNAANPGGTLDLILAGEPRVSFELDMNKKDHPLTFTASALNKVWYDYRIALQQQLDKIALLTEFINRYPSEKDAAVLAARQSLDREKASAQADFRQFVTRQGNSWAGKLVQNRPLQFAEPKEEPKNSEARYHRQYWHNINTHDTTLLNSPLYAEHMYNYLSYYLNPAMGWTDTGREKGFREAVDTIVHQFSAFPALRKFALGYLTKGFQQIGQETVLQYIDERYNRQEQCSNEQADTALQKRLAAYEALKPGMPAPEITYASVQKAKAGLKDIAADTVIVAFWASWCPHCTDAMPALNTAAAVHPGIRVLAVSLDEDPKAYIEATARLGNMLHLCEYRKWKSKPVADYHVTATPTFFMLDRERRIMGRYSSVESLEEGMQRSEVSNQAPAEKAGK